MGCNPCSWPVTFTASPMRLKWTFPIISESAFIGTMAARSFVTGAGLRGAEEDAELESSNVPVEVSTVCAATVMTATVKAAKMRRWWNFMAGAGSNFSKSPLAGAVPRSTGLISR